MLAFCLTVCKHSRVISLQAHSVSENAKLLSILAHLPTCRHVNDNITQQTCMDETLETGVAV